MPRFHLIVHYVSGGVNFSQEITFCDTSRIPAWFFNPNANDNTDPWPFEPKINRLSRLLCQVSVIPIRSFHFIVLIHITRHTHRDKVIAISVSMYYIVSMDNEVFIFIQQATFTKANIIATTVSMTIAYVPKHPVQQYFTSFHECFHLNILQPQNCSIIAEW